MTASALNSASAAKVANALAASGYSCDARQVDVSDSASVDALIGYAADKHGKIDILFSNAGILLDQTLERISDADWDKAMSVIVTGAGN